ncbi:MAG: pyridoxal phosphate-dependent decarboxylase family protein [Gammaproteobacteria bacterium]
MRKLIEEIRRYEEAATALDPGAEERRHLLDRVSAYTEQFLESLPSRPAFINSETQGRALYDSPISETGADIDAVLRLFKEQVVDIGLSPVSGKFLAYIPPCATYHGALGDFLAAVTNEFSGNFFNCPGAVRMEHQLIRWLAGIIGYPRAAHGNLASGGSTAMLTCVVTAREAHGLKARDYERTVVYMTEHTHHSMHKALHVAGMGECVKRIVPMDSDYRMDPRHLDELIAGDRKQGLNPWMLVASSGTTDVGAVDPLDRLGEIAKRQGLWYHVDGAYGGLFILSDRVKDRFKGIELSDSVVMNPHKALFTPFGLGVALVRDGALLSRALFHTANYMQDSLAGTEEVSPADTGLELTRHFRAPRLWLPLKLIGVAPFRAALSEKILLTRYAWEKMRAMEGMDVSPYPDLSVFAFRYVPKHGDADEFNRRLNEELLRDGTVFLSSTVIDGRYMIRFAVLSFRTHVETIDLAIEIIERGIRRVGGD